MNYNEKRNLRIFLTTIIFITFILSINFINGIAAENPTVFTPSEINDVLNNPYMGFAPWANGGPYPQPHSLVYINISWADLEPTKGVYAFNAMEAVNKFDYWRNKGVKIILRINMDYPGSDAHMDIPTWLYDEINGDGTWYDIPYGKGFSPNYNNPLLISYHELLINALAARYDNDSLIPFIAIGSIGHWGEFHTWKGRDFTIPFPTEAVTDQYVSQYKNAFKNKFFLMRRPFQIAKENNFGLFNDSFGNKNQTYDLFLDYINNGYTDYLTNEYHPPMPDFWKSAPSGGEFANYPGTQYVQDDKIDQTIQEIKDTHVSWLGPSFPSYRNSGNGLKNNIDLISNTMGYRFQLKSISHLTTAISGENLTIDMIFENKGVAPFYFKWPVELSLSDSNGNIVFKSRTKDDITTWLPGEIKTSHVLDLPYTLVKGNYSLCLAIIDPSTNNPGINLGISGKRPDGRYTLDNINISTFSIFSFFLSF